MNIVKKIKLVPVFLTAFILTGCLSNPCDIEGLDMKFASALGITEQNSVEGEYLPKDYQITLEDLELTDDKEDRHICSANLAVSTTGKKHMEMIKTRYFAIFGNELNKDIDKMKPANPDDLVKLEERFSTTMRGRGEEFNQLMTENFSVKVPITYAINNESGELLGIDSDRKLHLARLMSEFLKIEVVID